MQLRAEGLRAEIVHNWTGRFFAVLQRSEGSLLVQELCRKAWGKGSYQYRFGDLTVGYIVPNRQAFLPGSEPFLTTVGLVPWRGGRLHAVWREGALVETCPADDLGVFVILTQRVGLANAVIRPEAGPREMTQRVCEKGLHPGLRR